MNISGFVILCVLGLVLSYWINKNFARRRFYFNYSLEPSKFYFAETISAHAASFHFTGWQLAANENDHEKAIKFYDNAISLIPKHAFYNDRAYVIGKQKCTVFGKHECTENGNNSAQLKTPSGMLEGV